MRVIFLGTSGYHPTDSPRLRETSCVMLPELGIVLDAGTGFHRVRNHIATPELHIFLSHYHWDHVIGLTFLLDVLWQKQVGAVHIYGKPGIRVAVGRLFRDPHFPVALEQHPVPIRLHEISGETPIRIGDAEVWPKLFPHHSGGSLGYRIERGGKSLVYITDTTVDESFVPFVQDANLFICECNFSNEWVDRAILTTHSWSRNVGQLAEAASVGALALYHLNALVLDEKLLLREISEEFSGEIEVARDFLEAKA